MITGQERSAAFVIFRVKRIPFYYTRAPWTRLHTTTVPIVERETSLPSTLEEARNKSTLRIVKYAVARMCSRSASRETDQPGSLQNRSNRACIDEPLSPWSGWREDGRSSLDLAIPR